MQETRDDTSKDNVYKVKDIIVLWLWCESYGEPMFAFDGFEKGKETLATVWVKAFIKEKLETSREARRKQYTTQVRIGMWVTVSSGEMVRNVLLLDVIREHSDNELMWLGRDGGFGVAP